MLSKIRIASRKSDLARLQAYSVGNALKARFPQVNIEFLFRESLGDQDLQTPLWQMGDRGVFTQDFYQDLLQSRVDLVVHSWKDLPVEPRKGVAVVATLPREDVRDVLLVKKNWTGGVLKILTSSPRRVYNLQNCLAELLPAPAPKFEFLSIRGNVQTRIRKMIEGEGDALVVAKAALDRLMSASTGEFQETKNQMRGHLDQCRFMVLPYSLNPSAAAQGALALELKADNGPLREMLLRINSQETFSAVEAERRILKNYGGGCHQKIGINVLFRPYGRVTFLKGLTDQGQVLDELSHENLYEFKPWPKATGDQIFPPEPDEAYWFERQPLKDVPQPKGRDLFVARENAWTQNWKTDDSQVVWTAGLKSWRKLALRGVWVSGCNESLGEREMPELAPILGRETNWLKISHDDSMDSASMEVLPTYLLKERDQLPDLKGKTHFFWMSGSQFQLAVRHNPSILKAHHGCGPGLTHDSIRKLIDDDERVRVFLSHAEWKKAVLK